MYIFFLILFFALLMCAVSLVGAITIVLKTSKTVLMSLIALSSGALLGGAFFHMLPEALEQFSSDSVFGLVFLGFLTFFTVEQLFHYHHCHREDINCHKPLGYIVLLADAIHKFIGGLTMGSVFMVDIRFGITIWFMQVIHEIPHKLGDFAALVTSGWNRSSALLYNVLSSSTFVIGAILAFLLVDFFHMKWLIPFAAGNFIYIAASDLVPEIKKYFGWKQNLLHILMFSIGASILVILHVFSHHLH